MSSQTAEVDKERNLNSQQLRYQRQKIYRSKVPHISVFPSVAKKALTQAPEAIRKSNFLKFVDLYFSKTIDNTIPDSIFGIYPGPTKLTKDSTGYKAFSNFAETDYGSSVVKEMLDNLKRYKGFTILEGTNKGAAGDYKALLLPKIFPGQLKFRTSGQLIHDLAIIYHEFAHTIVFRSNNLRINIMDERMAVMKFENPVRMRKGYEPRYSYTMADGSSTINIITGKKAFGQWGVSKYDPSRLVKLNDPDILK